LAAIFAEHGFSLAELESALRAVGAADRDDSDGAVVWSFAK